MIFLERDNRRNCHCWPGKKRIEKTTPRNPVIQVLGYRREWFMKRKTKTLLKAIAVLLAAGGLSGFLTKNSMHVHDTIH